MNNTFNKQYLNSKKQSGITLILLLINVVILIILLSVSVGVLIRSQMVDTTVDVVDDYNNKVSEHQNQINYWTDVAERKAQNQ